MDFIKQYDKDHKQDRLYIHWDLHTVCNLKCSYCYARYEYRNSWNEPTCFLTQKAILMSLSLSTLPIFLGLQGGEPTLDPQYLILLDKINEIIKKNKDSKCYITTNGTKDIDFWKEHPYYDKFMMLWSFHPEYYHNKKHIKDFLNNIDIMINKGFKTKVNVMLHPNKKFFKNIIYMLDALRQRPVEIHPHFLYHPSGMNNRYEYSNEFYQRLKDYLSTSIPYFIFETKDGNEVYSDYDIFRTNLNYFKNWKCYNNNYEIHSNGEVFRFCSKEKDNLIENPFFFKKITEIKPIICENDFCGCDGMLKVYKEK